MTQSKINLKMELIDLASSVLIRRNCLPGPYLKMTTAALSQSMSNWLLS